MNHAGRPNQALIARQLGVSISTVSRALANEPGISERVRREVQEVARSIGYRAKRTSPADGQRHQVPALFPVRSLTGGLSGFYEGIVTGMRSAAAAAGIDLDVRLVRDAHVTPEQVERYLADRGARGLLLGGIDPSEELAAWCLKREVGLILVNGSDPKMRFSSAAPANFYGGRAATEQLLAAGHRRIVHLTYQNRHTIYERTRGFEAAIAACPGASGRVVAIDQPRRRPADLMAELLAEGDAFTAVFCMNDLIAVDVLESRDLRRAELPESFSVMGFDDLPCASMTSPRLSTIRVDREAIGRAAIALLRRKLAGEMPVVEQVEIGLTLVAGGTIFRCP